MVRKRVLAIGIEPAFADLSAMPGLTADLVRTFIDAQIERLRSLGYEAESCLIEPGEAAERTVRTALTAPYDCVIIGAGLRLPPENLLLFEKVTNLVHELAPRSRIAFNTTAADTAEAVQRWLT
ncbi:MAG TPA: hypothetical protein VHB68_06430 [Steroidobacteraceae bacterium]|nr:hypothetical protein [Steroidobacteraceae bacterium]